MSSTGQGCVYSLQTDPEDSDSEDEFENHLEFALVPGQRYGWWSTHTLVGEKRAMAKVHGAIFDRRLQILLDSGATTSIMSLDLARRLKIKLRRGCRLRVTGIGDVPTYVSAQARIKLTLGTRVVYLMDIWVGNIGEGVECLLGMEFMVAAGVRLCAREGMVRLPDEETLLLVGGPEVDHLGLEIGITPLESLWLQPGESVIRPVKFGQANPDKVQEWAGRGKQWVTQFLYGAGRRPKAVKIVNISDRVAQIWQHTTVACLVEKDYLPRGDYFVRPRSRKYREWAQLIFEAEPSEDFQRREEEAARLRELNEPPAVERHSYPWPRKILRNPKFAKKAELAKEGVSGPEAAAAKVAQGQSSETSSSAQSAAGDATIWPPLPSENTTTCAEDRSDETVAPAANHSQQEEPRKALEDTETKAMPRHSMAGGGDSSQSASRELKQVFQSWSLNPAQLPLIRLEMLEAGYEGWALSFDGAAKLSDRAGSSGCILWKLPSWDAVEARGFHFEGVTVNEAEYHGLVEGSRMALARGISDLVVVGDSRIVIQQAQGVIQCLHPRLRLLLAEFVVIRPQFRSLKLVHVKREFNAAADYLAAITLLAKSSVVLDAPAELAQLKRLNRIPETLMKAEMPEPGEPSAECTSSSDHGHEPENGLVSPKVAVKLLTTKAKIREVTRKHIRFRNEAETIQDVRWTEQGVREYLVKWKSCPDPEWLPMSQLNCGALLYEFNKSARAQARFKAMQAGNEPPEPGAQ